MLIPEPQYPDKSVRIVGVDPGTAHLGLCVLDWVWGEEQARVVWAGTINVNDPTHESGYSEVCGKRDYRMGMLREKWVEFLELARPTFITTETPFMKRAKLSAYESGVELQLMIRQGLWEVFPEKTVHGFNPIIVKSHVGVNARGTDKSDMYRAVVALYRDHSDIDLTALDEHSIDAIAVVNIFVRVLLLNLNSLLPPKPKKPKSGKRRSRRKKK